MGTSPAVDFTRRGAAGNGTLQGHRASRLPNQSPLFKIIAQNGGSGMDRA
jgi:hypothetical protein